MMIFKTETTTNRPRTFKLSNVVYYNPGSDADLVYVESPRQTERKTLVNVGDKLGGFRIETPPGFDYVNVDSLLSIDASNEKLAKTAKRFSNVLSFIHYGAPAGSAGKRIHTCSHATRACSAFCLNTSGKGSLPSVQLSRIARTRWQAIDPGAFFAQFEREVFAAKRKAARQGKQLAIRPNGTTDIMPPALADIIDRHDDVIWYDYTAVPNRVEFAASREHYHVTVSRKETTSNHNFIAKLDPGVNVAVVCVPEVKTALLRDFSDIVVDGDLHDLRIPLADGKGKLVLLTPKGQARGKQNGFIASTMDEALACSRMLRYA